MTDASYTLPNNLLALKALIAAQRAEIERLRMMIAKLRRTQFGRSSEQLDAMIDQLQLGLEELHISQAELTPPVELAPRAVSRRKPLPEHLPREIHVHQPESQCSDCGGTLRYLGEDVAEILEYVPARFKVIRHVRPKLVCGCCEHIAQAPAPSRPIARGIGGPGLLAHVLVSKFVDHLPLYRQSEIYAREGVDLERSTLADWVGQCSQLLRPLINALERHVMSGHKVHADDTPIGVLVPGNGKTKRLVCGHTCGTTGLPVTQHLQPSGSPIRRIARANTRVLTSKRSTAFCRLTATLVLPSCMRRAQFRKLLAGPMPVVSFTTSTKTLPHHWPPKRCNELPPYMPSKVRFAGNHPT